jgi:hypothetical protein
MKKRHKPLEIRTLEEGILLLQEKVKSAPITLGEILQLLSGKGRALILILLSLPFCQPLQIPGLSTPFGLAIAFIGLRMAFGKHLWLPQSVLSKTLTGATLQKITDTALLIIRKLKPWIHRRLDWICHSSTMQIVNGLSIVFLGVLLALPLPIPLSNLTAAWAIFLIALGNLEDDGIFVIAGYLVLFITLIAFVFILFTIDKFFDKL